MHLTRESEYALRGLVVLTSCPTGATLTLAEIAEAKNLPSTFLAKIFQKLARHGLVVAARGPGRGYTLARSPSSITIYDILESVEGPSLSQQCLLWNRRCADTDPCPLHHHVRVLLPKLDQILRHITLADYAEELTTLERQAQPTPPNRTHPVSRAQERFSLERPDNRWPFGRPATWSTSPLDANIPDLGGLRS
jgi:Rrf2 family protein